MKMTKGIALCCAVAVMLLLIGSMNSAEAQHVWASGNSGAILHTSDGGANCTWQSSKASNH